MPSAGRPLGAATLRELRRRGVRLATLTHAAGLSATGDPVLDAALPLPEPYEIPSRTASLVRGTRRRGGRVVAVGTTVVRALEGAALEDGLPRPGAGETDLVISPRFRPRVVDGLLSGVHEPRESHHRLLGAFAPRELLEAGLERAVAEGYHNHEFGDSMLLLPGSVPVDGPHGWYLSGRGAQDATPRPGQGARQR